TSSFTIEGWIKVNGLPTNYNFGSIMFRGDDRPGLDPYQLVIKPNGDLQFQINSTTGGASVEAPIPTGQFVHVAATLDDATGTMTLYENGTVVAQTTTTVRPFGALDPTQQPGVGIGNSNALSNYDVPFNGLIDELSVYNRALTPGEVLDIYKAGSSGKVISPISVSDPSVVNGSGSVTFTLTRTNTSGSLTVNWTTADDTAKAGTNYVAASGTVTFADGQATQTVQVTTLNDPNPEPNVDFELIATPSGGTSVMGVATILTDNTNISVSNDTATEGGTSIRSLGAFVPAGQGGLTDAYGITYGPDGNVYVSTLGGSAVYRYDPTGNPLPAPGQSGAAFVPPGSGGLSNARDIAFGPDGYLYVVSQGTNSVLRYDPVTGTPAGLSGVAGDAVFIPSGSGGLDAPRGLLFRGSYVYVTSVPSNGDTGPGASSVLRFDAATGAPAGVSGNPGDAVFISSGSGGLTNPSSIVFGPDGNAYVSSTASSSNAVLCYDGTTGAFLNTFVASGSGGLDGPVGMVFRPDGYLYVVGWRSNSVQRYQASNGAFAGTVVPSGSGGANSPIDLLFEANGNLLVTSRGTNQVLRYGATSQFAFTVSLSWASVGTTTVDYLTGDGTALASSGDYVAVSGTLTFQPGQTSQTVVVQTLDDGHADPTKYLTLNLSNPTGGVITSGQGIGTILDDTKFYVVDSSSSDKTYQYGSSGTALGNNALSSGDTTPRGVATTAAGTTEWVVDANKNVYVYNTGGALLGSWSAGGLSSSAQLTGIATNGTDIWLVDSYTDKVYKFTGAASRLSGSQNAASSFSLANGHNGDPNPQDIVTDGTSFWVVDGTKLKVFKYTLSGSLLGSWTIDPADTHPTGITINPNNVSDIWIVDNGTDKVYQYVGAASRISGSQSAGATFALAAGNTNPQGIADPPTAYLPFTPAASPLVLNQPSAAAVPSLSIQDAALVSLARKPLERAGEFLSGRAITPLLDSLTPFADLAWTNAGALGGANTLDSLTTLTASSSQGVHSDGSAMGLQHGTMSVENSEASAMDLDSTGLTSESRAED
ncbi:MAG TPA: Calx-beta domain-containing protein, partial [Gemmataceae bacterium]|nr:Calx-beta domain-containing protein [Gemmataceae bacterium]